LTRARRARLWLAPITAPGPIDEITTPSPPEEPTDGPGRASLRLLGLDGALNRPRTDGGVRAQDGSR